MSENRLAAETSPYLIQHKDNPVHWWPWGPEAFAQAKASGKPILLSVGYAACHWCHVMAHESFEDRDVAAVMNELFVNIKVDREERPDVDQIYMGALQQLGEQGGWPLTMFLTPEGAPFWGGTYFPKTAKYGRPGFTDVLFQVSRAYGESPDKVAHNTDAILTRLQAAARPAGKTVLALADLDKAAGQIAGLFDRAHGGLRGAPKFPQSGLLELLWRAGTRTGDEHLKAVTAFTLNRMCEGGIYDHLGGGFSRYSVDEMWLVPHFEKMLYDNAQLLELLALAYAETGDELFLTRARETVGWLKREMLTPEGAFAASLDADSEGHEGKFYVWTAEEIVSVLGRADAEEFAAFYDVSDEGNWEGSIILNRTKFGDVSMVEEARLGALKAKLQAAREKRVRPGLDDKVLADWNGLMIAALARAGALLDEPEWVELAARAFRAVTHLMVKDGVLGHSYRAGKLLLPGLASDLAAMARAGIALHEATGDADALEAATAFVETLERDHLDPETGAYFLTSAAADALVVRPFSTLDEALPNYNAVAADALIRLAVLTGRDDLRSRGDRIIAALSGDAAQNPLAHASLLNVLDTRLRLAEIVAVGPARATFADAALRLPFLDRVVVRAGDAAALPAGSLARARAESAPPEGAAFVCVAERCSLPVTDPEDLAGVIRDMRG
ncbi:thioredoxin domain-containing protein [Azorhizobium oxalatiphilum]|uniref:Thioredoxin domain-containing protein n=1 Tax=Azorhizobium oxalatiphilum TaxID=980631 RepID=A0A917C7A3_9HYPH|nr:thioredoxin domain-containing protein [Azorhizobium oxalatiphilum]GGF75687.1 thioredoxin domain-containing protein [Azorhizobium oxalatiphilum]